MTDIKKTAKSKGAKKAKKFALHKETVKDLSPRAPGRVRGGAGWRTAGAACG